VELVQSGQDSLFCALYHTRFHEASSQIGRPPANKLSLFKFGKEALEHVHTIDKIDYYQRHIMRGEHQLFLYGGTSFYGFNLQSKKCSMVMLNTASSGGEKDLH
jgi:hypothetical protein